MASFHPCASSASQNTSVVGRPAGTNRLIPLTKQSGLTPTCRAQAGLCSLNLQDARTKATLALQRHRSDIFIISSSFGYTATTHAHAGLLCWSMHNSFSQSLRAFDVQDTLCAARNSGAVVCIARQLCSNLSGLVPLTRNTYFLCPETSKTSLFEVYPAGRLPLLPKQALRARRKESTLDMTLLPLK